MLSIIYAAFSPTASKIMACPLSLTGNISTTNGYEYEISLNGSHFMIVNVPIHPNVCSTLIMLTVEHEYSSTSAVYLCNHNGCNATSYSVKKVNFTSSCRNDSYSGSIVFPNGASLKVMATAVVPFSIANAEDLFLPFDLNVSDFACSGVESKLPYLQSKESSMSYQ